MTLPHWRFTSKLTISYQLIFDILFSLIKKRITVYISIFFTLFEKFIILYYKHEQFLIHLFIFFLYKCYSITFFVALKNLKIQYKVLQKFFINVVKKY